MNYALKMMSGTILFITTEEFKKLDGKTGLIYIPSQDRIINLNSVETITPTKIALEESRFTAKQFYDEKGNKLVWNKDSSNWLTWDGFFPAEKLTATEHLFRIAENKHKQLKSFNE